jgi:hypothetical protein
LNGASPPSLALRSVSHGPARSSAARSIAANSCIDTTNNTNSLLLVLDQLKLLQHHTIAAPVSQFLITEGPHNTAVIRDRKINQLWTVDPWTHQGSEVPDKAHFNLPRRGSAELFRVFI